jgi:hypothetical protein
MCPHDLTVEILSAQSCLRSLYLTLPLLRSPASQTTTTIDPDIGSVLVILATRCRFTYSSTFPVIWAEATLLKNSTKPAKSEALPTLPVGCLSSKVSRNLFIPKFVMREGKTPGQITLHMIFRGASFDACNLVRCMHAAFDGPSVISVSYIQPHKRRSSHS